jgi:hypothetical protein
MQARSKAPPTVLLLLSYHILAENDKIFAGARIFFRIRDILKISTLKDVEDNRGEDLRFPISSSSGFSSPMKGVRKDPRTNPPARLRAARAFCFFNSEGQRVDVWEGKLVGQQGWKGSWNHRKYPNNSLIELMRPMAGMLRRASASILAL